MPYDFDWVDAFTTQPFGGNGCVVVHKADRLTTDQRMAVVRETSLAECAFIVDSDVAEFGVRYYLADREIGFAGHPTVATAVSLLNRGLVDDGAEFNLEVGAGVVPIKVGRDEAGGPRVTMTQARPEFGRTFERSDIAAIFELDASDIIADPQQVSTGTPFIITLLRDKDALRRAKMNFDNLSEFRSAAGITPEQVLEPFLVTLGGATDAGNTFSRLLLPPPSLPEDPFTGSATGCMAAWLWQHGHIDTPNFVAEQGHWLGRPGSAEVNVVGSPGSIKSVIVSGSGRVLMQGQLHL